VDALSKLRRLETIIGKLAGSKVLIDEAIAHIEDLAAIQPPTTEWWDAHGPIRGKQITGMPKSLIDLVVASGKEPLTLAQAAAILKIESEYARRLTSRADTQLHDRGASASISIDNGVIRTASTSITSLSYIPPADRTNLS